MSSWGQTRPNVSNFSFQKWTWKILIFRTGPFMPRRVFLRKWLQWSISFDSNWGGWAAPKSFPKRNSQNFLTTLFRNSFVWDEINDSFIFGWKLFVCFSHFSGLKAALSQSVTVARGLFYKTIRISFLRKRYVSRLNWVEICQYNNSYSA